MKNLLPIYKKELRSFFYSPIAYIVITVFLVLSGWFFYAITGFYSSLSQRWQSQPYFELNIMEGVFRPLITNISVVMLLVLPMLTMRLFSEEKKSGTIELLFTYPLKDEEIILGKYFAAMSVFTLALALTLVQPLILAQYIKLEWGTLFVQYLGLFLLGLSFMAIGIFASSMTENQIISAVVSFGTLLFFWLISWAADSVSSVVGSVITQFSIIVHFENFSKGVLDTQDIVFYLLFSVFFLYLTYSVLGTKKWRG
ncbi:MAG: ABC transporter permease subunit [Elusimicrobiota bacterium]